MSDTNAENVTPRAVLALVRDLIFASRISATARALGVEVKIVRDPAQLAALPAPLLLVDLNQPGTIPAAAGWKAATGGQVVGFVSHVDTGTIETARQAGIDRVMARSGFVDVLPQLLKPDGRTSGETRPPL